MSERADNGLRDPDGEDRLAQAASWFLRVRAESAGAELLAEFRGWLERDSANASAYRRVAAQWEALGACASAPEIMVARRDALEDTRRASRNRWRSRVRPRHWLALAASVVIVCVALATLSWMRGTVLETELGERRTFPLVDGSIVTLDARSRLRVMYTDEARQIVLETGQARFEVAKDPTRPFRVRAGDQTVVALGTQFNVEIVAGTVLVTLIEGQVAITGIEPQRADFAESPQETPRRDDAIEIQPGQQLIVAANRPARVRSNVDVGGAVAWQTGKVVFDREPLASAAARINRYARRPIDVDPSVAAIRISGIFNAGDTDAFTEAVSAYFPIEIEYRASDVRLTARHTSPHR